MEQSEQMNPQSGAWQDMFSGQWRQMRGTLRSWWGKLTDDDWEKIAGHKDRLLGMLQEKYGYTKDMAQREMERRFRDYSPSASAGVSSGASYGNRPSGSESGSMGSSGYPTGHDTAQGMKQAGQETAQGIKDTAAGLSQKAGEALNDAKAKAQEYGSAAVEKARGASAAMGEKMSSLAGSLRGNAPEQGMMGSAAHSVADSLDTAGSYLQDKTVENMAKDLTDLIRRYPVQALLIGLGIGYLFSRRSER